jgi:hypothetical protein
MDNQSVCNLSLIIIPFFQETVIKLTQIFDLNSATSLKGRSSPNRHRNISIVLGCIAEKLAGPRSIAIFTKDTLDYLITNLVSNI